MMGGASSKSSVLLYRWQVLFLGFVLNGLSDAPSMAALQAGERYGLVQRNSRKMAISALHARRLIV
jgi:hypothetical protein